ncbi:hypothetical protein [uncultured Algibacter sp.]|uniref:hypothetical protein n=1 Tax=uncultured Algibacter sp. TaxID=298659 RepID=UPI00260C8581|nr:hypothetical protein [uncultured Algibacter sp.]
MKNVINNTKKGILMVALLATVMGFAKEASFTIKNESDRTSLALLNVKKGNLLSIKDANGLILYKESIKTSGTYTKGFDLTSLPDGSYFFELDKDVEIRTIPFNVKSNTVVFDKEKAIVSFKPIIKIDGDMVYISKLALDYEPLKIKLYVENDSYLSNNYKLIYSEEIKDIQTIERVYKLDKTVPGNYKIIIFSEGREFAEHFKI